LTATLVNYKKGVKNASVMNDDEEVTLFNNK